MPAMAPNFKNNVINVINHRETNVAVTSIFIIVSLYISLCAILQKNLGNPLDDDAAPLLNFSNRSYLSPLEVVQPSIAPTVTVMALFLLWVVAMVFGQVVQWICLPPLLGMLLGGILIRNTDVFAQFWNIDAYWDSILRSAAFLLILIRCGINLEPDALKRSLGVFSSLGFISTTVEALAVVLASHFIFEIGVPLSILFAFVLTSTSPAVTVPSMIKLQDQGRGTNKGIPTTILAAASIDNIYCITAFSIVSSVIFTKNEDLTYLIVRIPIEVLIGMLFGILFGLLLRVFPRDDVHHVHFIRCVIISSFSTAMLFATRSIGCEMVGPISVFMMVVVASMRWKIDNHRMTRKEERCFKIVWDDMLQPFLFALIGLLFDFSQISWDMFWDAMLIIFIGAIVRMITVFIMSIFMFLSLKEKIFVSVCFFPKATVQAALAPLVIQYTGDNDPEKMSFIFNTCVLSILVTAPIGQLIIDVLGRYLLDKEVNLSKRSFEPLKLPNMPEPNGDFKREPSFIQADKDNRLRLQVTPTNNTNPTSIVTTPKLNQSSTITTTMARIMTPPTTPKAKSKNEPPPPSLPPPSFDDIHSQAFEIFKEQRLKKERFQDGNRMETITELQTSRPSYIDHKIAKF